MTTTTFPIEQSHPSSDAAAHAAPHARATEAESRLPERIVIATAGISIFTMGVLAYFGPGPYVYWLIAAAPLACILLSIYAVMLSLLRERWEPTFYFIFGLPFLAGISLAGLLSAPTAGPAMGVVLTVAGGLLVAFGANAIVAKKMP
jgi:hypothetical protein